MSTRSNIGVKNGDKVEYISCLYNGQTKYAGSGLLKYFNDRDRAEELMDQGSLEFINVAEFDMEQAEIPIRLFGCNMGTYEGAPKKRTVPYSEYGSKKQRKNQWNIEYFYLFDDEWLVSCYDTDWRFVPVADVLGGVRESRSRRGRKLNEELQDNVFDYKMMELEDAVRNSRMSLNKLYLRLEKASVYLSKSDKRSISEDLDVMEEAIKSLRRFLG